MNNGESPVVKTSFKLFVYAGKRRDFILKYCLCKFLSIFHPRKRTLLWLWLERNRFQSWKLCNTYHNAAYLVLSTRNLKPQNFPILLMPSTFIPLGFDDRQPLHSFYCFPKELIFKIVSNTSGPYFSVCVG